MERSLPADRLEEISKRLSQANAALIARYPGPRAGRQPVHVVYGGAQLFRADTAVKLGALARQAFAEYAPDARALAQAVGMDASLARVVHQRVRDKLEREAVEDFRIDFEDGYGNRPDAEEDGHAVQAATEVAAGMKAGRLPPFIGIRIKPLSDELRDRSLRTLDLFVTALVRKTAGKLPSGFVVTLAKISVPEHVSALADAMGLLESALNLPDRALRMELMIETTQAILNDRGECSIPYLVAAADGRCVAAHFGTYDYTAACSITAAHQSMTHPACDFAKHVMQVSLAGTGIWLSDGATNVMPVPPHRASKGKELTLKQQKENRAVVHAAWKLHYEHARHSLVNGYYQGWDLHPAQLPTRYAAVYAFFLEGLEAASQRLRNFIEKAAQATLVGEVFDDAATGQGLLNYFLRAVNCGAVSAGEVVHRTGLTLEEVRTGSFVKIMKARAARLSG